VGNPQDQIPWGTPGTTPTGGTTGTLSTTSGTQSPAPSVPTTPSTPAPTQSQSPTSGEYTVKQGETFSSIALSHYGDPRYYREIVKANPTLEPSRVRAGTVIKLPDAASVRASRNAASGSAVTAGAAVKASEPAIDPTKEYRVAANDSLHKISMRLYGKPDRVDAIYEANKDKIGSDPHRLKLGMVLKLPEAPTVSGAAR
jgi:nucleoid-associated protein YgaU